MKVVYCVYIEFEYEIHVLSAVPANTHSPQNMLIAKVLSEEIQQLAPDIV